MRLLFLAPARLLSEQDKRLYCSIVGRFHRYNSLRWLRRLSATADGPVYLVTALALLWLSEKGQHFFLLLAAGFAIELPLYWLLKNSIRRTRPCHQALGLKIDFEPSDRFSLPSGHTAGACVYASAILAVYPVFAPLAFAWAAMVGLSRIGLGVHYPLDIVAGAALGIGAFGLVPATLLVA